METQDNTLHFNLQRFADTGEAGSADEQDTTPENGVKNIGATGKPVDTDKQTDEAAIQKRIDDALAAAKSKWEKDYKRKAEAAKKEAERLSKLSDDERAKAELENSRKELEAKEQELKKKNSSLKW